MLRSLGLVSYSMCLALLWISSADSQSVLVQKQCQNSSDCIFPHYFLKRPQVSCVEGFCKCDSKDAILATAVIPVRAVSNLTQYYGGYYSFEPSEQAKICAPHAGTSCYFNGKGYTLGVCAPGSFCALEDISHYPTLVGTCKCNPHRSPSQETGLCLCDEGYTEDSKTGECHYNLPDSCEKDSDCGIEYQNYTLICSNGKCTCQDETTIWGAGVPRPYQVHVTGNELQMCLPRAGRPCTAGMYCSTRSVCTFDSENPSEKICSCVMHSKYSNETGFCECEPGYKEHKSSLCIPESSKPCNVTSNCKSSYETQAGILSSPVKCVHGICICDPAVSVEADISKTSLGRYLTLFTAIPVETEADRICSKKPKESCIQNTTLHGATRQETCSPGSYCTSFAWKVSGTCTCTHDRLYSSRTGLCECQEGLEEDEEGRCVPGKCGEDATCGTDKISKFPRVCLNATCVCNPANSVLASVRSSDLHVSAEIPEFREFHDASTVPVKTFCAPKVGHPCTQTGLCAPLSKCVYSYVDRYERTAGNCSCIPHSQVSNETGLCECLPGYTLSTNGTCDGALLFESCSDQNPCSLDYISMLPLSCINGTCLCNPEISVYANTRPSLSQVHAGDPAFRGYQTSYSAIPKLCAPKAGQNCVGQGYCSPNSYCVYDSLESWDGKCRCKPNMIVSNSTGLCECPAHFDLDGNDNCRRRIPESCTTDFDCGSHPILNTQLHCSNGLCVCNPSNSIGILVKRAFVTDMIPDGSYVPRNGSDAPDYVHLCVIKPGQLCRNHLVCAPGSNCEITLYTGIRICRCSADKVISQVTGLCECDQGYYQNERGFCVQSVGGRCGIGALYPICGLDYGSKRLRCENSTCACNSFSPAMVIQYTPSDSPYYKFLATKRTANVTICVSRPGDMCNGYCTPDSFCADENFAPTFANGTCICNPGTSLTSDGTCGKVYQASCNRIRPCSAGLFCIQGRCQCQLKSQIFNETKLMCISSVGGPCREDDDCAEFSKCHGEECVCSPGFVRNSLGQCFLPYGGICKESRECGPIPRFQCSANRCQCSSSFHYSESSKECLVGQEGVICSPQPDSASCVDTANCTLTAPGLSSQNVTCLPDTSNSGVTTTLDPLPNDPHLSPSGMTVLLYVFFAVLTLVITSVILLYVWKRNKRGGGDSYVGITFTEAKNTLHEPESN